MRAACEAILRDAQDPDSGGFSYDRAKKAGGGLPSGVIPCLTGNMVFALLRLGMLDDRRVQRGLDWITTYQRFDDGDGDVPTGWPYDKFEMCWGRHTCHMGAVKALKALAEVPPERRTPAMHATIGAGAEYLLRHHIFKRSHDLTKVSKPGWKRFGFPLMYQTDVLEDPLDTGPARSCVPARRARARSAGPRRRQGRRPGPLEARADLQRPLRRAHRDQGRAEPLGDAPRARGAESCLNALTARCRPRRGISPSSGPNRRGFRWT